MLLNSYSFGEETVTPLLFVPGSLVRPELDSLAEICRDRGCAGITKPAQFGKPNVPDGEILQDHHREAIMALGKPELTHQCT